MGAASHRYTVILAFGAIHKEKSLCEDCFAAFQHDDLIELPEPPLLMCGGNNPPR